MRVKSLALGFLALLALSIPRGANAETAKEQAIKAGATQLKAEEIAELLVGKTVTARAGAKMFLFHYGKDNVLSGKLIGGNWSDTGFYGITDEDRVCLSITKDKGRMRCVTLLKLDGAVNKYNARGDLSFELLKFEEGNRL